MLMLNIENSLYFQRYLENFFFARLILSEEKLMLQQFDTLNVNI